MFTRKAFACAVAAFVFGAPAYAGPEWVEGANGTGDAGSVVGGAQRTAGPDALNRISGSLGGLGTLAGTLDFEDMYLVEITEPVEFSMTVSDANFDAQLFVFNVTQPGEAFGLLANDDGGDANMALGFTHPFLSYFSTDDSGAAINLPGVYAIAISASGNNPVSQNGQIFSYDFFNEVSGPDGPGGINPHIGWQSDFLTGEFGNYQIDFTATNPVDVDVPAPGALALLGLAGLAGASRRRRA